MRINEASNGRKHKMKEIYVSPPTDQKGSEVDFEKCREWFRTWSLG
jgi:hypothetical protein